MKASASIEDKDMGMEELFQRIRESADHVDIGVHADAGEELVKIAAANEFGARINHPGGTAYGYATKEDMAHGIIKFLKGGAGYKVLGKTRPHLIIIPMRSYIRSTMDENQEDYHTLAKECIKKIVDGEMTKFQALSIIGQKIESDIKRKITTLKTPANAASTIRRKKSDNPLVDKGILRSSIRYVVGSTLEEKVGVAP